MNRKKQIRRIRTLLHDMYFAPFNLNIKDEINKRYKQFMSYKGYRLRYFEIEQNNIAELKKLVEETNISESELLSIYLKQKHIKKETSKLLKHITPVVRRDNKGVYIGSGTSESFPTYRYPSKKRSLKTWKTFYEMFPTLAERDNWDGKTSNKMK